jgi:hypothetical protein
MTATRPGNKFSSTPRRTHVCAPAVPSPSPATSVTFGDQFGDRFGLVESGSVPAMWSSALGLALLSALHPVRLGLILLLISRPRQLLIAIFTMVGVSQLAQGMGIV